MAAGLVIQQHRHSWATLQGPSLRMVDPSEGGVRCCGSLGGRGGEGGRDWLLRQGSQLKASGGGAGHKVQAPPVFSESFLLWAWSEEQQQSPQTCASRPWAFPGLPATPAPGSPGTHRAQGSLRNDLI